METTKKHTSLTTLLVVIVSVLAVVTVTWAINETIVSKAVTLNRLRVTFTDVKNGTDWADSPGGKRVVIKQIPAANAVTLVVNNVTTAFTVPGAVRPHIFVAKIVVEDAVTGLQLSTGDLGMPFDMNGDSYTVPHLENRLGNTLEYPFYDENNPVDLVYYFMGQDYATGENLNLGNLNAGQFDAYLSLTKP